MRLVKKRDVCLVKGGRYTFGKCSYASRFK